MSGGAFVAVPSLAAIIALSCPKLIAVLSSWAGPCALVRGRSCLVTIVSHWTVLTCDGGGLICILALFTFIALVSRSSLISMPALGTDFALVVGFGLSPVVFAVRPGKAAHARGFGRGRYRGVVLGSRLANLTLRKACLVGKGTILTGLALRAVGVKCKEVCTICNAYYRIEMRDRGNVHKRHEHF